MIIRLKDGTMLDFRPGIFNWWQQHEDRPVSFAPDPLPERPVGFELLHKIADGEYALVVMASRPPDHNVLWAGRVSTTQAHYWLRMNHKEIGADLHGVRIE